jgi:hypothetical protein
VTKAAAARTPRLVLRPEAVAGISGLLGFAVQAVAGWPGWLSRDSAAMLQQATAGGISDTHPPLLTWAWAMLQPAAHGPLLPFLLQLQVFWIGVTLAAISLQPGRTWTRFLPLLMLVNPAAWTMLVVRPQSALTAMVALAIGVAALAVRSFRNGNLAGGWVALWLAAVAAGGAAATSRHFLPVAVLLVLALAAAVVPRQVGRRRRNEIAVKAVIITFATAVLAAVSAPAVVIGPVADSRADEASFALDAYHADCAAFWSQGQRAPDPVSPEGLWRTPAAPCEQGIPGDYRQQWTGFDDPTGEQLLGLGAWLGIVAADPGAVLGGRIQHLAALLTSPVAVLPAVAGPELAAAPGAGGIGETVGQPNRGGLLLALAAAASAVVPSLAALWIVALPLASGWWVRRQWRGQPRTVVLWPLLLIPAVISAALALIAPTTQAAAMAPGAVLGGLIALWAVGVSSLRIASFAVWRSDEQRPVGEYPAGPVSHARRRPERRSKLRARLPRRRPSRKPRTPVAAGGVSERRQPDLGPAPLSAFVAEIDLRDHQPQESIDAER